MKKYIAPSMEEIKLTAREAITDQVDGSGSVTGGGRG